MATATTLPNSACLNKTPSCANTLGQEFEYKLSGLVNLRARRDPRLHFLLSTNVEGALPFDDVFLRLGWREGQDDRSVSYYFQLKHSESSTATVNYAALTADKGDFSLKKYFSMYEEMVQKFQNPTRVRTKKDKNDSILYDGHRIDDVRFIIYTNKYVQHNDNSKEDSSKLAFPFSNMFNTGEDENEHNKDVFSFSEHDTKVWELFKGEDCEDEYQNGFLQKLRVFCRQKHVNDFADLLSEELEICLGSPRDSRLTQSYLARYVSFMHTWWQTSRLCLSEMDTQLEDLVDKDVCHAYNTEHCTEAIVFNTQCLEELKKKINRADIIFVAIPNVPEKIRASKVMQCLKNSSSRYLVINDKVLSDFPRKALEIAIRKTKDVLVIDTDNLSDEVRLLLNAFKPKPPCQIIVVSNNYKADLRKCLKELHATYEEFRDYWALSQLTDDSQKDMMGKEVLLQGRSVTLSALEGAWPGLRNAVDAPMLAALATGDLEGARLGAALPAKEDAYVPRTLQHATTVREDAFKLKGDHDIIAYSGFTQQEIKYLLQDSGRGRHSGILQTTEPTTSEISLNIGDTVAEDLSRKLHIVDGPSVSTVALSYPEDGMDEKKEKGKFEKLSTLFPGKNIHWLRYENGLILWKETRGNPNALISCIERKSPDCENKPICTHKEAKTRFSLWGGKATLITGEPGIGKSKFLQQMARNIGEDNPTEWVIYVSLNAHREDFNSIHKVEDMERNEAMDILAKASGLEGSNYVVARNSLESHIEREKNVVVLIDGVDEVCPAHKDKALKLLLLLLQMNLKHIWVTSRTLLEDELRTYLHCAPLKLNPLLEEEQVEYLHSFWKSGITDVSDDLLRSFVRALVQEIKTKTQVEGRSICDVPLHTHLVAVAYAEKISSIVKKDADSHPSFTFSILTLYKTFIEKMQERYRERYQVRLAQIDKEFSRHIERSFVEIHMNWAMVLLFSEENFEGVDIDKFQDKIDESPFNFQVTQTGIIHNVTDERPEFIHRSFAEYFVALWMAENYAGYTSFISAYFNSKLEGGLVKYFFDLILAEGHPLHEAVIEGRTEALEEALKGGADPSARDGGGRLALHLAAIYGRAAAAARLLALSCVFNERDRVLGWTPLKYADQHQHLDVIEKLLERGGDRADLTQTLLLAHTTYAQLQVARSGYPQLVRFLLESGVSDKTSDGITALHLAAHNGHEEVVKVVLSKGIKCDQVQENGRTAMHDASQEGHLGVIQILLEAGADVNAIDEKGITPVMLASGNGHVEVVKLLRENGANVLAKEDDQRTALHYAAQEGRASVVDLLLSWGVPAHDPDRRGVTPLHLAAGNGNVDIMMTLMKYGAPWDVELESGRTALHFAAQQGSSAVVQALLDLGGDPNHPDQRGVTPLHLAAGNGNMDVFKMLVAHGGKWEMAQKNGRTPIHDAAQEGHVDMIKELVRLGADVNVPDGRGITPVQVGAASGRKDVVEYLMEQGATWVTNTGLSRNPLHYAAQEGNAAIVNLLLSLGSSPNSPDEEYGVTPVHLAAIMGNLEVFDELVANGGDWSLAQKNGRTALHDACQEAKLEMVKRLLDLGADPNVEDKLSITPIQLAAASKSRQVFQLLVDRGAKWNTVQLNGRTPLHHAAQEGSKEIVHLLIKLGADVNAADQGKVAPIHLASANGHFAVLALLIEAGACLEQLEEDGRSALHYAAQEGKFEIATLLLTARADASRPDRKGVRPIMLAAGAGHVRLIRSLQRSQADVNAVGPGGRTPLIFAVQSSKLEATTILLDLGADVNAADENGIRPLHIAAGNGNKALVQLLLDRGADIEAKEKRQRTALHYAVFEERVDVVETLITRKADINAPDEDGTTVIQVAALQGNAAITDLLLKRKARWRAKQQDGRTALHHAAQAGGLQVVQTLLGLGLGVNAVDKGGISALHLAAASGKADVVEYLLDQGGRYDAREGDGRSPLHYAAQEGHFEVVRMLLDRGANPGLADVNGITPMHLAAGKGNVNIMNALLDQGAPADYRGNSGRTALHAAVQESRVDAVRLLLGQGCDYNAADTKNIRPLHVACIKGDLEVVNMLLDAGATPTCRDDNGFTPIFAAVKSGNKALVATLLDKGEDPNVADEDGTSIIHITASCGEMDILELLLSRGGNWDARQNNGRSPLHFAAQEGHAAVGQLLLALGADPNLGDERNVTPMMLAAGNGKMSVFQDMLDSGGNFALVQNNGRTCLHQAVQEGYVDMAVLLLGMGMDANVKDNDGITPMHLAAAAGHLALALLLLDNGAELDPVDSNLRRPLICAVGSDSPDIVEMLLSAGADANRGDNTGLTPLHMAALKGNQRAAELLLQHRAEANAIINLGLTPLHFAAKEGHIGIASALLRAGADPMFTDEMGHTPLELAAMCGHEQLVALMLPGGEGGQGDASGAPGPS